MVCGGSGVTHQQTLKATKTDGDTWMDIIKNSKAMRKRSKRPTTPFPMSHDDIRSVAQM